jgi:signal transduction histidine kinase
MRSLRETLTHLRPPEIDDLGLVASLQTLVLGYNRRAKSGTTFTFAATGDFDDLPGEMAAHAYRIVQEGLNNAARHANAKNVSVSMENAVESPSRMHRIEIAVIDDGSATPAVRRESENGIGLIGIRERVHALSGRVAIGQRKPHGFELRVSFPVREGEEDTA